MVEGDKNGISQRALDVVLVATWKSRHGSSVSPAVLPVQSKSCTLCYNAIYRVKVAIGLNVGIPAA